MTANAVACGRCRSGPALFFEAQSLTPQEQPDRIMRDADPVRGKFVLQPVQCQMRCLPDPLYDEGAMRIEQRFAMSAHLTGCHRTGRTVAL